MQAEATALNVPVRFLHKLRTLLPQAVDIDDTGNEEDAWPDPNMDSARELSSDSKDKGYSETSELQMALMAAPQMIAATSGTLSSKTAACLLGVINPL